MTLIKAQSVYLYNGHEADYTSLIALSIGNIVLTIFSTVSGSSKHIKKC